MKTKKQTKVNGFIHPTLPKANDLVTCSFCNQSVNVISVTADKYGGYTHLAKHDCIDLSSDRFYKAMKEL
jgi:hypothetical protein